MDLLEIITDEITDNLSVMDKGIKEIDSFYSKYGDTGSKTVTADFDNLERDFMAAISATEAEAFKLGFKTAISLLNGKFTVEY